MDLPDPGIKLGSPEFQADSLPAELAGKPLNSKAVRNTVKILNFYCKRCLAGFPSENPWSFNAGDPGLIPGSGRSAGGGIGYPLQYSWASLVAQLVKNPHAM